MTSLIIGPIYLTYEKVKEHRAGKKRIKNIARYEDLRREAEGGDEVDEEKRSRLDQERMKTGFAIPEMSEDGRVRLSRDWESDREREWEDRTRAASLQANRTGRRNPIEDRKRGSWHGDYRGGSTSNREYDLERDRDSPVPRRSLQVSNLGREYTGHDSQSDRSSRNDMSRSREYLEPQTVAAPKRREEEPKDMSSSFIDDLLKERGLR